MSIKGVNWGDVHNVRPPWCPDTWRLWAVWPSPIDHDQCFEEAGFHDFADSDSGWHSDFATIVGDVVDVLERKGRARLSEGEYPVERGRASVNLTDAALAAATNDQFRPCTLTFGDPPLALLRTSDGHPILWIAVLNGDVTDVLAKIGQGREVREHHLEWAKLLGQT